MSLLNLSSIDGYLAFDEVECREAGRRLADAYQNASPFPHVVIDDFLDQALLRLIASGYPSLEGERHFDRDQERLKYQFHSDRVPSGLARNLLAELNGRAFLGFIQEMTGIAGLISDPYLAGGGLHVTKSGGHLGIHADFNIHEEMQVERRLNLLIYLNQDWQASYGGNLELWDRQMKRCEKKVMPLLGRAVVFNTSLDSYHGHPDPLDCPPEVDRRSIATYYYTALATPVTSTISRTTTFQARPFTTDRTDWRVKVDHLIGDWIPPRLQRYARRLNRFR